MGSVGKPSNPPSLRFDVKPLWRARHPLENRNMMVLEWDLLGLKGAFGRRFILLGCGSMNMVSSTCFLQTGVRSPSRSVLQSPCWFKFDPAYAIAAFFIQPRLLRYGNMCWFTSSLYCRCARRPTLEAPEYETNRLFDF